MECCKETPCTRCTHRPVCKHKDDFLIAVRAVNDANVYECEDDVTKIIRVKDIDCVSDISVTCRYHQPEVTTPKKGIF